MKFSNLNYVYLIGFDLLQSGIRTFVFRTSCIEVFVKKNRDDGFGRFEVTNHIKLKSSLPINYKSCSLSRPKPSKISLWDGVVADVVVLDPPVVVVVDGGRGWRHGDGQRHVGEVGEGLKHHVVLAGRGVLYSDPGKFS